LNFFVFNNCWNVFHLRTILLYFDDVLEQEAHLRARKNDFKLD